MNYYKYWVAALQKLAPAALSGKICQKIAKIEIKWLKNSLIWFGTKLYFLNMAEAIEEDPYAYKSAEALFIRRLKPKTRPISQEDNCLISPTDGTVSQAGKLGNTIINAKNHAFEVADLIQEQQHNFNQGSYCTIYLAPNDYHRVHMPIDGQIINMKYVPGKLYSVAPKLYEYIPNLLSKNERLIINIKTKHGNLSLVMVGAMNVGNMVANWHGVVKSEAITQWQYDEKQLLFKKGDELGYFTFGSTVVVLFDKPNSTIISERAVNSQVKYGQMLSSW